jgi:hypothetical protein
MKESDLRRILPDTDYIGKSPSSESETREDLVDVFGEVPSQSFPDSFLIVL